MFGFYHLLNNVPNFQKIGYLLADYHNYFYHLCVNFLVAVLWWLSSGTELIIFLKSGSYSSILNAPNCWWTFFIQIDKNENNCQICVNYISYWIYSFLQVFFPLIVVFCPSSLGLNCAAKVQNSVKHSSECYTNFFTFFSE